MVQEQTQTYRILWVSRHSPLDCQIKELERIFGNVDIFTYINPFKSAEEIVDFYRKENFDDMLIVAPLSVIQKITEHGIYPLWAEMKVVENKEEADTEASGRYYKFIGFKRIKEVKIIYEDLNSKV